MEGRADTRHPPAFATGRNPPPGALLRGCEGKRKRAGGMKTGRALMPTFCIFFSSFLSLPLHFHPLRYVSLRFLLALSTFGINCLETCRNVRGVAFTNFSAAVCRECNLEDVKFSLCTTTTTTHPPLLPPRVGSLSRLHAFRSPHPEALSRLGLPSLRKAAAF